MNLQLQILLQVTVLFFAPLSSFPSAWAATYADFIAKHFVPNGNWVNRQPNPVGADWCAHLSGLSARPGLLYGRTFNSFIRAPGARDVAADFAFVNTPGHAQWRSRRQGRVQPNGRTYPVWLSNGPRTIVNVNIGRGRCAVTECTMNYWTGMERDRATGGPKAFHPNHFEGVNNPAACTPI